MPPETSTPTRRWKADGLLWDLWLLRRRLEWATAAAATSVGLSPAAAEVIVELSRVPKGLSQRQLAARLRVQPPSISTLVSRLAEAGVVERVPDAGDNRTWTVRLTRHRRVVGLLERLAREEDGVLDALKPSEVAEARVLLGRLSRWFRSLDEVEFS
jgi:DNA-binding MarR family transcriptional regulator